MNDVTKSNAPVSYAEKAWQSDVIVDLIKRYGFPYIALNPGASYPRPARLAGQLRRQPAADDAVPAREDRGADRPRLRQGDRQADGGDRARPGRPAARHHGASTTPISTACRSSSSAPPGRWTKAGAGRSSTGSTPPGAGRRSAPLRQMGLSADQRSTACRIRFARAYSIDDDRAAGPDLHVLRRRAAGAAAVERRGAADGVRQQGAGADGGRPEGARSGRRQAAGGRNIRCCWPNTSARSEGGFDNLVELAETVGAAVFDVNMRGSISPTSIRSV